MRFSLNIIHSDSQHSCVGDQSSYCNNSNSSTYSHWKIFLHFNIFIVICFLLCITNYLIFTTKNINCSTRSHTFVIIPINKQTLVLKDHAKKHGSLDHSESPFHNIFSYSEELRCSWTRYKSFNAIRRIKS